MRSGSMSKDREMSARTGIMRRLSNTGKLSTKQWIKLVVLDKDSNPRSIAIAERIKKNHERLIKKKTQIPMNKWTEIYSNARKVALREIKKNLN